MVATTTNNLNIKTAGFINFSGTAFNSRTLTGTTNQISVTNGTGASGNPVLSLSPNMVLSTQPNFKATQSGGPASQTGDGTAVTVVYSTKTWDQGTNFSSPTFTAPVAGVYKFCGAVSASGPYSALYTTVNLAIKQNSTIIFQKNLNAHAQSITVGSTISVEGSCQAAANDTFTLIYTVSGSSKTIGYGSNAQDTYFCGNLIF